MEIVFNVFLNKVNFNSLMKQVGYILLLFYRLDSYLEKIIGLEFKFGFKI